jgi:hypothetical protein
MLLVGEHALVFVVPSACLQHGAPATQWRWYCELGVLASYCERSAIVINTTKAKVLLLAGRAQQRQQ